MGFTIGAAFDLLFAPGPGEHSGWDGRYEGYGSRRWFRRPRGDMSPVPAELLAEAAEADEILALKISASIPKWAEASGIVWPPATTDSEESIESGATKATGGGKEDESPVDAASLDRVRHIPPRMPYDVFAIAAYLIEYAGIYHHLQPVKIPPGRPGGGPGIRHMEIFPADRAKVLAAAQAWRSLDPAKLRATRFAAALTEDACWEKIEPLFESWWIVFGAGESVDIFDRLVEQPGEAVPFWWKHAWRLFAIADEAAERTGFRFDNEAILASLGGAATDVRWYEAEVMLELAQRTPKATKGAKLTEAGDITTLTVARQSIVSVLPKVRTSTVGCTLRSLSHHLALLPGAGVARGRWTPNFSSPERVQGSKPDNVLNFLLVPLPYSLTADVFHEVSIEDVTGDPEGAVPKFGYFGVHQKWISPSSTRLNRITAFLGSLVEAAQIQSPDIGGIVFPELSLDYETFSQVRDYIASHIPACKILVAGTSSNSVGTEGNFVAVASFEPPSDSKGKRVYRQTLREKHHRWKLDRQQLKDYGLLGVLSPELSWWENIALQNRRIDFTVLQRDTVFAAMICEDLARVDPCQQVIRAIGPNLVVALLMDAPQLADRWPARYATVLAEDPGCAVLTLTSRGLMTRQHRLGIFRSNGDDRVVGLWRDDKSPAPIKLRCPYDAQAVLLSIVSGTAEDVSLDGRTDHGAKAWRYVGDVPVRLPGAKKDFGDILGAEDQACW